MVLGPPLNGPHTDPDAGEKADGRAGVSSTHCWRWWNLAVGAIGGGARGGGVGGRVGEEGVGVHGRSSARNCWDGLRTLRS